MSASPSRYATVAIVLHWLIAAAIVLQIILGWRLGGPPSPQAYSVFQLHKSVGITILVLSLARLAWRLTHPPPPLPAEMPGWERLAARATHWGFYTIMIGLPVTGWVIVSTSRLPIPTTLYGVVKLPGLPGLDSLAPPARQAWNDGAAASHEALVWLTFGLLALHVAAALKHHFVNRDLVLGHMVVGVRPGRLMEPRLGLIVLGALAVAGVALGYTPRHPAVRQQPATLSLSAPEKSVGATLQHPPSASTPAPRAPAVLAPATPTGPYAWKVLPGSHLNFATSWSGQPINGEFKRWHADIRFSPDALKDSRLRVVVEIASVATDDASRDSTLLSGDWFDAAAHPQAILTANRFAQTGPDRFTAHGTLQMRGASIPVTLPFTLKIDGANARATGALKLSRTTFGVGQGEWSATDQIPAEVDVSFRLTAVRR